MDLIYMALSAIGNFIVNGIAWLIDVLASAIMTEFIPVMEGGYYSMFKWNNMGVSDRVNQIFPFMRPANHIFLLIAISMVCIIFTFNVLRSFKPGLSHDEGILSHIYRAILAMVLVGLSYSLINGAMWLGYQMIDYTKRWNYMEYYQNNEIFPSSITLDGDKLEMYEIDGDGNLIRASGEKVQMIGEDVEQKDWDEMTPEEQTALEEAFLKDNPQYRGDDGHIDFDKVEDGWDGFKKFVRDYNSFTIMNSRTMIGTDRIGSGLAECIDLSIASDKLVSGATGAGLAMTIIVPVIVMIAILWNFCKLFMEMAERLIVTTFVTSLAPLGFCSVVSKETEGIFFKYLQMVFSTYLVFIIDIWFLRAFIYSVGNTIILLDVPHLVWNMFLWLALLITAQKADQHLREAGLSVSQTGGNLLGEMMLSGRLLGAAGRNGLLGNSVAGTRFGRMIGARTVAPTTRQTGAKGVGNSLRHYMGNDAANNLMNSGLLAPTNDSHFLEPKIKNGKENGFVATMAGQSGNAVKMETVKNAQEAMDKGMTPFYYNGATYGLAGDKDDVAAITGAFGGGAAPVVDDATLHALDDGFDDGVAGVSENADAIAAAEEERQLNDDLLDYANAGVGQETKGGSSVDMAEAKSREAAKLAAQEEADAYTRSAIDDKVNAVNEAGTAGMSDAQRAQSIEGATSLMGSSGLDGDYAGCFNFSKSEDPAYMTRTKAVDQDTGRGVEFQTIPSEYASVHPEMFEGRTPVKTWTGSDGREYSTYRSAALNTKESVTLTDLKGEVAFAGNLNKTSTRGIYTYKTSDQYDMSGAKPRKIKNGETKCVLDPDFVTIPKSAQRVELADGKALFICDVEKAGDQRKRC